jgi:hypothetical protein
MPTAVGRTTPTTALQSIGMGLVLTLVDATFNGYDAVPDVLGWVLVVIGLWALRKQLESAMLLPLAAIAGLVSLVGFAPGLLEDLPESRGWLISLPQIVFSLVLCAEVAKLVGPTLARRFRGLRWVFLAVALGPVLLYGGGVDALLIPLALLAVGAGIYLVYLLFRASAEFHGPRVRLARDVRPDDPQPPAS